MSAYDDAIALARGADYLAVYQALFTKMRDDVAALTAGGLTSALVYGARQLSAADDVALVAADSKLQLIAISVAGKAVAMPAANVGMVEGEPWIINNAGAEAFALNDSTAAAIVAALPPGESAVVWLVDDSTAAGVWAAVRLSSAAQHARALSAARLSLFNLAR